MSSKKINGLAKWVLVAIAVGGILSNAIILWNDVKHIKGDIVEIKQDIKEIRTYLLENK